MTTQSPVLFLIDGSALAYRSHFALIRNPLVTSRGELVSGIFGFTNTLLRILEHQRPSHLAVVFDAKGPTFRHERYQEYKATREKMPDELVAQLPGIHEIIDAMNIPLFSIEGYEADDVIGTLACRAKQQGMQARIVSGDKDFFQLVDDDIKIFQLGKGNEAGETLGPEIVLDKFGIRPDQMIDYLALRGDSSDNVPGIPGVGEKTAKNLLATFDSMDQLLQRVEEVKRPALQKKIRENVELAELSRELVTIHTDLELDKKIDELRVRPPDREALVSLFQKYEFRTLIDRIPKNQSEETTAAKDYRRVQNIAELKQLAEHLRTAGFFVIDTETTSLDPMSAMLVGIAVATKPAQAWYIPLEPTTGLFAADDDVLSLAAAKEILGPVLADPKVHKAGQNIKYDTHVLERSGLPIAGVTFDTMIAHYCIEPSATSHSLDSLALEYYGFEKTRTKELIGSGKKSLKMNEIPIATVADYACEDADYTLRLVATLQPILKERQVLRLFEEIELPLIRVLLRMERFGVSVDLDFLHTLKETFQSKLQDLTDRIYDYAGDSFNINSTKQLGAIIYEELKIHEAVGLKRIPKTKTGYSTSAAALQPMMDHEFIALVLEYRQIEKLRSTYVDALPRLVHAKTGRIHTSFNQAVAATGRLSSSDPNLQNIPIRTPLGREIRRAFRSSFENGLIVSADYSQVELRVMAHLSQDQHLIAAFMADEDVHRRTASLVFSVEPDAVDGEMRTRAKAINFGIMYGMGAQRLARETGLSFQEAKEFITRYFEVFAGVKKFLDQTLEQARKDGYVSTLLGRRRYVPELTSDNPRVQANAQNIAVNTPIQGTAADLIKKAMIDVDRRLLEEQRQSRMVLQVHDELVFDVKPDELDAVQRLARECMENALELRVPLKVDLGQGQSWYEAH